MSASSSVITIIATSSGVDVLEEKIIEMKEELMSDEENSSACQPKGEDFFRFNISDRDVLIWVLRQDFRWDFKGKRRVIWPPPPPLGLGIVIKVGIYIYFIINHCSIFTSSYLKGICQKLRSLLKIVYILLV